MKILLLLLALTSLASAQMTAPPAPTAIDEVNAQLNALGDKVATPALLIIGVFGIFSLTKIGKRLLGVAGADSGENYSAMHHNGRIIGHIKNKDR